MSRRERSLLPFRNADPEESSSSSDEESNAKQQQHHHYQQHRTRRSNDSMPPRRIVVGLIVALIVWSMLLWRIAQQSALLPQQSPAAAEDASAVAVSAAVASAAVASAAAADPIATPPVDPLSVPHLIPTSLPAGAGAAASSEGLSDVPSLRAQLVSSRAVAAQYRRELGKLSCEKNNVGYTGGFCMYGLKEKGQSLTNEIIDVPLARAIERMLKGQRVYDIGCGSGRYGRFWMRSPADASTGVEQDWDPTADGSSPVLSGWSGVDGSEGIEEHTSGWVQFGDLSMPLQLSPVADWVVSLEVGEHLPATTAATFIANLHRANSKGMVLSWAVRNQGGYAHINELDNHEVISMVTPLGYTYDGEAAKRLQQAATFTWFAGALPQQNGQSSIMVFRRNDAP